MYTMSLLVYNQWGRGMSDKEMMSGRVPNELKQLVDADPRNNQEVLRSALWREFGGERMADVERRIREKEKRVTTLANEISDREEDREREKQELEALRSKLNRDEEKKQTKLNEAKEAFSSVPNADITKHNPAVENWADKLNIEIKALVQELLGNDN